MILLCLAIVSIKQFCFNVKVKKASPHDSSKHFTLYFPDRPVHSDTILASLGSIQPYATINARRLLVHISTRYSFIQLSELEQCRVKTLAQVHNAAAQDSNPAFRSRESETLPLSHCILKLSKQLAYCFKRITLV